MLFIDLFIILVGIETAGKAWRSVAKRDDSLVKPVTRPAGGATNAFEKAREVCIQVLVGVVNHI